MKGYVVLVRLSKVDTLQNIQYTNSFAIPKTTTTTKGWGGRENS
jgi:hypothetical protein